MAAPLVKDIVNHIAYLIAVLTTLVLLVWSIVHIWTKQKDSPHFTDLHMTLTALVGSCITLLLLTVMHKASK